MGQGSLRRGKLDQAVRERGHRREGMKRNRRRGVEQRCEAHGWIFWLDFSVVLKSNLNQLLDHLMTASRELTSCSYQITSCCPNAGSTGVLARA
jgi:hypothetical protein